MEFLWKIFSRENIDYYLVKPAIHQNTELNMIYGEFKL